MNHPPSSDLSPMNLRQLFERLERLAIDRPTVVRSIERYIDVIWNTDRRLALADRLAHLRPSDLDLITDFIAELGKSGPDDPPSKAG